MSWVRSHPNFQVHIHNLLDFHTSSVKLHEFVICGLLHMFTKHGLVLFINKKVNVWQSYTIPNHMSWVWARPYFREVTFSCCTQWVWAHPRCQRESLCAVCCGCGAVRTTPTLFSNTYGCLWKPWVYEHPWSILLVSWWRTVKVQLYQIETDSELRWRIFDEFIVSDFSVFLRKLYTNISEKSLKFYFRTFRVEHNNNKFLFFLHASFKCSLGDLFSTFI